MACFSADVQKIFSDWKKDALREELEDHHAQLVERRVNSILYGDPSKLGAKKQTMLNSQVLRQALLHRADCLLIGSGTMLLAKNVYGLALVARGHLEATAVLAYFCDRVDAFSQGNIDFDKFEWSVADAVMGSRNEAFPKANPPPSIMTCIEKGDRFLDKKLGKKLGVLSDNYGWLSEFAHPNYCSNKSSFSLDKATGSLVFRHDSDLQGSDFELLGYLAISAKMFPLLFDEFAARTEKLLAE